MTEQQAEGAEGARPHRPRVNAETVRRIERATGTLGAAAITAMEKRLPWFRNLSAENRSWLGLVAQAGIAAFLDWIKAVPDQIARWVPGTFTSLGTDGFGFSDTRPAARRFFHVDAESITLAVLWELARSGAVDAGFPAQAIERYRLDLSVSEALS